ncbi:MAG: hypothetical protein ABJN69_12540 [Hellea sp.]
MGFLYDAFDYLPEFAQRPVIALLCIIVGYFLSKIFAALLSGILPTKEGLDTAIKQENFLSLRRRMVRSCFWVSWLGFIILGFNQLPLLSSAIKLWLIEPQNFTIQFLILLGGGLLLAMDETIQSLHSALSRFFRYKPRPKLNKVFQFILRIFWIPLALLGGWALNDPQATGIKIIATLLVLLLGYLLGNVIKTTAASLMGLKTVASHLVPKFLFYCVGVTFFMTAIGIWV